MEKAMTSGQVDAKLMTIVRAIKQSIETSNTPGLSVNAHPNAFFLNVNGAVDLKRAAEQVLTSLESYVVAEQTKFEADVKKVEEKLWIEQRAGAVNIEDALARIRAKGELLVSGGAVEAAVAKVLSIFVPAKKADSPVL
jgi:hypothetical protein